MIRLTACNGRRKLNHANGISSDTARDNTMKIVRHWPPVPPKEELLDVIDEVTGTQAITVVGADGKKKHSKK